MQDRTEDIRIRHTKNRIKSALIQMLQTVPIHRITVTSLCKSAEVNRGTFYCYYADAYQVLEEIERERFESFLHNFRFPDNEKNRTDAYESVFDNILKNMDTVRIIFSEQSGSTYYHELYSRLSPFVIEKYRRELPEATESERVMLAQYAINGAASVVKEWIFDENRCSSRAIAEFLVGLFQSSRKFLSAHAKQTIR